MSWLIPGISESSLPNPLEPLALSEETPPDVAAVSPVLPDVVPLEVAGPDVGPTADTEVDEMDETEATLFCDALPVVDWTPDVGDSSGVMLGGVLNTGVLSDGARADALIEALEGATTSMCVGVSLRIKL